MKSILAEYGERHLATDDARFCEAVLPLPSMGVLSGCGLIASNARPLDVPIVGILSGLSQGAAQSLIDAFQQGLSELGYIESQNVVLDYRFTDGRDDRLPELAAQLLARQVRVIFAPDTPAALAAKAATETVPIVVASSDPVGLGLVASLARPGGNITGLSFANVQHAAKNLELLKQAAPAARRVVALWYTPNTAAAALLRELQDASPRLGVELQPVGVKGPDDFDSAFQAAARERADALFVINTGMNSRQVSILEFVHDMRLPAMFVRREYVEGGGLMSYGVDFTDMHRRAAAYVDKILKGTRPADLPIEQHTKFDFVINIKTARTIVLNVPESVLEQATELIQ